VIVFCTQVSRPNRIDRSWTFMTRSEDHGTYVVGVAWDKCPETGMAARTEGEMELTAGVLISKDGVKWTLHEALHTCVEKLTPGGMNGRCEPSLVEPGWRADVVKARPRFHAWAQHWHGITPIAAEFQNNRRGMK
jgi:hypothetical protein